MNCRSAAGLPPATANFQSQEAVGQFGGTYQAGVTGHAMRSGFRSVFNREAILTSHKSEIILDPAICVPRKCNYCPVG